MGILRNLVTAGDYKGADIKVKGTIFPKAHLITQGLFSKDIVLNKQSVERIELIDKSQRALDFVGTQTVQAVICFRNGKKSMVLLTAEMYQFLNSAVF